MLVEIIVGTVRPGAEDCKVTFGPPPQLSRRKKPKKTCKRRAEAWLGVIELRDPALMAIYKPLKVSTIEAGSRNSRSNSSTGFELLTEFMLTDVVERRWF